MTEYYDHAPGGLAELFLRQNLEAKSSSQKVTLLGYIKKENHKGMIFDTRGIDWSVESEKSKWLKIPEHCKRCYINNHRLLRKRDPDCDAVFIAAGLITIVYKNFPEAENHKPFNIYEGILTGEY